MTVTCSYKVRVELDFSSVKFKEIGECSLEGKVEAELE